jgi:hypothetical protein
MFDPLNNAKFGPKGSSLPKNSSAGLSVPGALGVGLGLRHVESDVEVL